MQQDDGTLTSDHHERRHRCLPPSDLLRPEAAPFACPECGDDCTLGFRGWNGAVLVCHAHGSFYAVDARGSVHDGPRPDGSMEPARRRVFLDLASRVFLANPEDGNFLVVQSSTLPCDYVMARRLDGRVRVEVCSREWGCAHCGDRPLSIVAQQRLRMLGFTIPGPRENPERWVDALSPADLGNLLDLALVVAFDDRPDAEVTAFLERTSDLGALAESLAVCADDADTTTPGVDHD